MVPPWRTCDAPPLAAAFDGTVTFFPDARDEGERFAHRAWPRLLDALARRVNIHLPAIAAAEFRSYYWCLDQAEVATDAMFRDRRSLAAVLPDLVRHASLNMSSVDVLRFLGRKLHPSLRAEVATDTKGRQEGWRVKHRLAAAALLLAGAVAFAVAALRAEDAGAIDPNAAATLTDLGNVLLAAAAPVALGIVTAATALASLRTGILPTWLGWVSVVLSVGLVILPINFMVVVLFLVWAVIVGILLYVQPGPTTASSSAWSQQGQERPLR